MTLDAVITGVAVTAVGGGGAGIWRWVQSVRLAHKRDEQARREHDKLISKGLLSLQHHEIYELCNYHLSVGHITTAAMEDLDYLMESYESLGGDGTAHILHAKVHQLPLDNSDEPDILRGAYPPHIRKRYEREVE